jgi:hypothetical protein
LVITNDRTLRNRRRDIETKAKEKSGLRDRKTHEALTRFKRTVSLTLSTALSVTGAYGPTSTSACIFMARYSHASCNGRG